MQKIAVTGASGMVGTELVKRGCIPVEGDLTKPVGLQEHLAQIDPDVLIHCAALTDVRYCEDHEKEAFAVNVRGTAHLLEALPMRTKFIYLSTDHVFPGTHKIKKGYGEKDKPDPVNAYGFTKWQGEVVTGLDPHAHLIVRTSRLFTYANLQSHIGMLRKGESVTFTNLIFRSFMYLPHFVDALLYVVEHAHRLEGERILHLAGPTLLTYAEFWTQLASTLNLPGKVIPRNYEITEAPRPFRGGLSVNKAQRYDIPLCSLASAFYDIRTLEMDAA